MPRDFLADKKTLEDMPPLSKEPQQADSPDDPNPMAPLYKVPTTFVEDRFKRMTDLHPFASLLNQDDLDDCDWLEHAAFDANEAASREKVGALLVIYSPPHPGLPRHTVAASALGLSVQQCLVRSPALNVLS
jgi:putative heme degradation protein